ncbi:MAG: addiction module protein [Victivallales bacterium]|nr:addiction module protein [Victivallales bacterium]
MSTIAEFTTRVLSLPSKSRAILADVLLDSLNDVEIINYDKLWIDEAQRRDKEITAGKVSCKPHSEVIKRARKELMCK